MQAFAVSAREKFVKFPLCFPDIAHHKVSSYQIYEEVDLIHIVVIERAILFFVV
jgi:hypothetical protein